MIETKRGLRKKGINGRSKGAGFENEVCKLLTPWWGSKFHRTPASGGKHWKEVDSVGGDIICEDKLFPFSIECKKQEDWNFDQIVRGQGEVYKYWEQCVRDAQERGKVPWLIFSRNLQPKYFMMTMDAWNALFHSNELSALYMDRITIARYTERSFGCVVIIGFLQQFLETFTKDNVLQALKIKAK